MSELKVEKKKNRRLYRMWARHEHLYSSEDGRLLGLASNHQVHWCEKLLLTTGNKTITSQRQAVSGLLGSPWEETDFLKGTDEIVGKTTTPPCHTGNSEEVPGGSHVLERTGERVVPRNRVRTVGQILIVDEVETGVADSLKSLRNLDHVGDTVTLFDTKTDLAVLRVVVVILVSHEPLVDTKHTTGLQHTENLLVNTLQLGSVDSRLDGINGIEGVVGEAHLHEVTLGEAELVRQTIALGIPRRTLNLVVVVVETDDIGVRELNNLTSWTTNTTADIQNLHTILNPHAVSKVVFVTGNGLEEGLAAGESTEVERGSPSVLIEVGSKVVVAANCQLPSTYSICLRENLLSGQSRILRSAGLFKKQAISHLSCRRR